MPTPIFTAVVLGIASHVFYFRIGEHHMSGSRIALCVPFLWLLTALYQLHNGETFGLAVQQSTLLAGAYATGLYSSMVIYRLFFHPLRHFPGPVLARTTKLWHVAQLGGLQNHVLMEDLHNKYGEVVRVGPNEVAIFSPDGIPAIHGPESKCTKAPWYDMPQEDRSMHATRNPRLHQARRRIWEQGFTTKALQRYQEGVNAKVELLTQKIGRTLGQAIECHELFVYFGFDVMGDIAFDESFGMLESNAPHEIVTFLRQAMRLFGRLSQISWFVTMLVGLPGRDVMKLERFATGQVLKRSKLLTDESDIMSKLIAAARSPDDPEKLDMRWLVGDSLVLIVAGSDTVSVTLTFLFYHLAVFPRHLQKLREEFANVDIRDHRGLQALRHLNALINETLRLYPPVPTHLYRLTPKDGLKVGNQYIPGGVTVSAPLWSQGRLESSYTRASEFLPERWYPESDLIKDRRGFAPFLCGKHACLGKQLALIELRLVTARLVSMYDFELAGDEPENETLRIQDMFTASPGPLRLIFSPRT